MLCYKDRTFCTHKKCKNTDCYRFSSEKTEKDAEDFGLPMAYSDFPECPFFPEEQEQ